MKDIQKYSPSLDWGDPSMEKDDNGDWHKVSDVEKLLAQIEIIKAYKLLKSKGLTISKKGEDGCYHVIHDMSIDKTYEVLAHYGFPEDENTGIIK